MLSIVTGATGGLGFAAARALVAAGHDVLLTGRNPAKGAYALTRLPGARFQVLDLASLASVRTFAASVTQPVRVLIGNAGVMAPDRRQVTADGFELQTGTNYLGHYALTALLLPRLIEGGARLVQVSSLAHRKARLDFGDLHGERRYRPWGQYAQSKLMMLMFALELDRRAEAAGWPVVSNAAHPGWAVTDIITNGPGGGTQGLRERAMQAAFNVFGQSADEGARPIVYAATAPGARGGAYYGPSGFGEIKGAPSPSKIMTQALDRAAASRLWDVSAALTGVGWNR